MEKCSEGHSLLTQKEYEDYTDCLVDSFKEVSMVLRRKLEDEDRCPHDFNYLLLNYCVRTTVHMVEALGLIEAEQHPSQSLEHAKRVIFQRFMHTVATGCGLDAELRKPMPGTGYFEDAPTH